ncbi:hypothetical protein JTB14_033231 [Gonioctena quinquepunctata]|nr:hypothetical protein JTB14_033231 [Gonioctena quinquepunctata]
MIIQSDIDANDINIQISGSLPSEVRRKFAADIMPGSHHNQTRPICKCGRFDVSVPASVSYVNNPLRASLPVSLGAGAEKTGGGDRLRDSFGIQQDDKQITDVDKTILFFQAEVETPTNPNIKKYKYKQNQMHSYLSNVGDPSHTVEVILIGESCSKFYSKDFIKVDFWVLQIAPSIWHIDNGIGVIGYDEKMSISTL